MAPKALIKGENKKYFTPISLCLAGFFPIPYYSLLISFFLESATIQATHESPLVSLAYGIYRE
jgi:hypothetical protein